ncbi:hypothetical protein QQS45_05480 [Alteriqipengyuania flavescens]|uniref:hypothetical protein n=1 Tax=Alteriqipengyuania flavescens TaxID=3053610 RepID=UPI0025B43816|nr:hypothetical protein [Alteriqipengyuania flavescens]WJY19669.1 hypothetical protein QQW98_05475 [Alteriqipengyuania flavescens]WJY25609.1 hypothetical protein QQS45_05480 [Alteriqipengyuania flavescens]
MNAMSFPAGAQQGQGSHAMRWGALLDAGAVLADLAGVAQERPDAAAKAFPLAMREAEGRRRAAMEGALSDIAAVMEPGMAALLAVLARGADARPAARALWSEFAASRDALLAMVPAGSNGPRRSA